MGKTREARREAAKAKVEELHKKLAAGVDELRSSDGWQAMLATAAKFHNYSLNNMLLILAQKPDATHVAGYRKWQDLGRQVVKGARSISILAPASGRCWDCSGEGHNDDGARCAKCGGSGRFTYFRAVSVFDIADTEGEDLVTANDIVRELSGGGDVAQGLLNDLANIANDVGFTVELIGSADDAILRKGAKGYCDHDAKKIVVRSDMAEAARAKTMAHELAHALMHAPDVCDYRAERDRAECEAESVAYVVLASHGIDADDYSLGYVAGWTEQDTKLVRTTAQAVIATARDIIVRLDRIGQNVDADKTAAA